jgi:exodeoxyribonuclease VII large subunit
MRQRARMRLARNLDDVENLAARLLRKHPRRRLNELSQRLDDLQAAMARCAKSGARRNAVAWRNTAARFGRLHPSLQLKQRRDIFEVELRRLRDLAAARLRELQNRFSACESRLKLLGPEQVLARGYSITMDAVTGKVLRKIADVTSGQRLKTRLKNGDIFSTAES